MKRNPYKLAENIMIGMMLIAGLVALFYIIHVTNSWRGVFMVLGGIVILIISMMFWGWWDERKDAWDKWNGVDK